MDTRGLNHLALMLMTSKQFNPATGQAGTWAVTSDLTNRIAREILREPSASEAVETTESPTPPDAARVSEPTHAARRITGKSLKL